MARSQKTTNCQLARNAVLELQHIKLELENGRAQHMRHFIDQYFCYKQGYVNKSDKADVSQLSTREWISAEAEKVRAGLTDGKETRDHIVPLKVIVTKLEKLKPVTVRAIKEVLDKWVYFAVITEKENKELREKKLNSSMPPSWDRKDPFARYKEAGIECRRQP